MKKKKNSIMRSIAAAPHIFWAVLFIILPLVIVVFYAFTGEDGGFSFENIASLTDYAPIFLLSLELSIIATAVCLAVGYPLAYIIARSNPKHHKFFIMLIMLPMWTNLLIRTYSIMAILDDGGLLNSLLGTTMHIVGTKGAVIFGMVYDFLPYMVLPIFTVMTKLDKRYLEASAGKCIVDIGTGIHDGYIGSVPVSHTLNAFNLLAAPEDRISEEDIDFMVKNQEVPAHLKFIGFDPAYGEKKVLFRRVSGMVRVTIFEGGHNLLPGPAFGFLERQKGGTAPVWFSGDIADFREDSELGK